MNLDKYGVPMELNETNTAEPYCPPEPCRFCIGDSACRHPTENRKMTSWEWCQESNTCAATVDWELIYQGR